MASNPVCTVLLNWSNWHSSVPSLLYLTSIFLYLFGMAMKPSDSSSFELRPSCFVWLRTLLLSISYITCEEKNCISAAQSLVEGRD